MIFAATHLLHEVRAPEAADVEESRAPQWVDLGQDKQHRRTWLRIQRDPRSAVNTLVEIYTDGHLVKSKEVESDLFMAEVPASVSTSGGAWFLFYDSHPGAGDTWFTNYLMIRKRDLRFEAKGQLEHGDSSHFQSAHHFYEYKLLKYLGDRRFSPLGVFGFKIVDWRWDDQHERFRQVRHWYAPNLPRHLRAAWDDPPQQRVRGNLVGSLDYFTPADPNKYGLPKESHFEINEFGEGAINLLVGRRTFDELNLLHGEKEIAKLEYSVGSPDPHHPPQLKRSEKGLVLTVTTCAFRQVLVSKLLVTTKPYRITLIKSWVEPEWTPFRANRR